MAFNNRRSWRLKFIDIDSSFVLSTAESPLNGYMVCRAPKGNQRPTYFPQGSAQAIDALGGVGSAHWPDLVEAKAFNDEYPLYISAPPGTSAAYPSYLGGFYVTKNGLYKFYNISDKQELADNVGNAYKVAVEPGREHMFNADFSNRLTRIIIQAPELEDFTPDVGEPGYGVFEFKKDDNSALILTKDRRLNVTDIDYDVMRDGLVSGVGTVKTFWGDNDGDFWSFSSQTASMADFGFKYNMGDDRIPLRDFIGQVNYDALVIGNGDESNPQPMLSSLMKLLVDGFVQVGSVTYNIPFGLQDIITFLVTLRNDTYCYFMQKGPTEIPTDIRISMMGYDKYRYDRLFAYAPFNRTEFDNTGRLVVQMPSGIPQDQQQAIRQAVLDNEFIAFFDPARPERVAYIGQLNEEGATPFHSVVTGQFATQYFTCQNSIINVTNNDLFHKIFYVETATSIKHLLTEEEYIAKFGQDGPNAYVRGMSTGDSAPKNIWFNALTVGCSEEVYIGRRTSGGEFTGSLDERGVDSFGSNIYFPEILQDDDVSFIEVRVLKKFGDDADDLDGTGFWTHRRIVDPFDMDGDGNIFTERGFTIEGDRYMTLLVTMNLLEQKVGGAWRPEFGPIIREGLQEALLPEYDDVYIFMELTGQEQFKGDLATISQQQELAAVISPKLMTPNNKGVVTDQIAQRAIVSGRVATRSNAQYCGEFEMYDPITFKKYWCQPVGDIGCNLMRIVERKYGGWAPAWYNIAGDLGGQLKRSVLRSRYQFEDEATKTLDTKGINPIVFTSDDGLMIVSQKTTQDPNFLSDWSFLGHSLSFQLVKREIRDNVMRPQIMKPINEYWMGLRQTQVESILARRTGGSSPIWAMATCDITGQNTPMTKAQRNFVMKVDIRVNVFSETVTLILENLPQI